MPALKTARCAAVDQPYPGLRPFDTKDAFLFFGREQHTRELLERLSRNRFLAVVGTSGSGKSSLVRAGLMPALYRGYLVGATSRWRIAVMRPAGGPIDEMARALADQDALASDPKTLAARLRTSSLGLVSVVRDAKLSPGESLLLVVDQFEELFRFPAESRSTDAAGEALLFVSSLLEAVDQFEAPIYIVLTMRTDYLGECTLFPGLPEALNRSQYLIPRLSREQRRDAIERPVEIANEEIAPSLVQQILNDMGDDPDQLPVMQHALARMYRLWKARKTGRPLDLDDYKLAGGMTEALNDHAQHLYDEAGESSQVWIRKIFRCLTKMDKGREVRRAARLDRVFHVVGAEDESARAAVRKVIQTFASPENSLLFVSSADKPEHGIVDISHESLIRKWRLLKEWVKEEAESAESLNELLRDTRRQATGDGDYWVGRKLERVLARKKKDGWTAAWAEQYCGTEPPGFAGVEDFLEHSGRKEWRQRLRRGLTYVIVALLIVGGLVVAELYRDAQVAKENEQRARVAADKAIAGELQARTELADLRKERAGFTARVDALTKNLESATSDSEKLKFQTQIVAEKSKIVESLQKENKDLMDKLAITIKVQGKGGYDPTEPVRAQLDQARREHSDFVKKEYEPLKREADGLKQELENARNAAKAAESRSQPVTDASKRLSATPATSAAHTPVSVRLEGRSVVRAQDTGLLLLADFHDFNKFAELYIISGAPTEGEKMEPLQGGTSTAKKTHERYVERLKSVGCDGSAANSGGYSVSCWKLEQVNLKTAGKSYHFRYAGAGGKLFNVLVREIKIPSDKDKATMEVEVQPAS